MIKMNNDVLIHFFHEKVDHITNKVGIKLG